MVEWRIALLPSVQSEISSISTGKQVRIRGLVCTIRSFQLQNHWKIVCALVGFLLASIDICILWDILHLLRHPVPYETSYKLLGHHIPTETFCTLSDILYLLRHSIPCETSCKLLRHPIPAETFCTLWDFLSYYNILYLLRPSEMKVHPMHCYGAWKIFFLCSKWRSGRGRGSSMGL